MSSPRELTAEPPGEPKARPVTDAPWPDAEPSGSFSEAVPAPVPARGPDLALSPPVDRAVVRRRIALAVAATAAVAPALGLLMGTLRAEHVVVAVIVALVVERTLSFVDQRYAAELEARQARLEAKVRERTAELELANIALRHEIEERSEVQRQLVDAERLAVAGGVAAGVCHEIRNPLSALMGNIELASERMDAVGAADAVALLRAALEGARQVEAVTGDLQALARPAADVVGMADLRDAVDSAVRLAMPYLRSQCELRVELQDAQVQIASSRLIQVLLNLLINAAKATRPNTRNAIEVRSEPADEGFVAIEVEDSGVGMDAAVQQRVFEPFYTTRRANGGTGLGLYLSRSIARACGGSLSFRSIPGQGTTFRLTLPRID